MPTVSVIVPVYNVESYLPRCIDSILAQTYTDFELILVNDGSTDGSGELCDTFVLTDSRVRVIHQENAGVSAARNTGLDAATGEFVGWVDSDDIIEADMFQQLASLAKSHQADIVQCQHDRTCALNNAKRNGAASVMDGDAFVRRMFTKQGSDYTNQVSLWSKIYRRELWDDIRFPVGMVYEDEMQTYKVCLKARKIVETEDILYHYVRRENSIITGKTHKKLLDKQMALADRLKYLPKKLPDLEDVCSKSFLGFSKYILFQMYQDGDIASVQRGIYFLMEYHSQFKRYINKYDRIYLPLLNNKHSRHWVLANDFEPIQKMIRKILWWKYRK